MVRGKFNVVIGAQAGSEAKGKLSSYLATEFRPTIIAGSFSPNAGHTAVVGDRKFISYHLPVAAAVYPDCRVLLGPSSVINVPEFLAEIEDLGMDRNRITVDPRAAVILPAHVAEERATMTKIGSTAQGVGLARVDKLMRRGVMVGETDLGREVRVHPVSPLMRGALHSGQDTVLYEMTQGFDLCLEYGADPVYCTSRVISPQMALAEMGLPCRFLGHVYGVLRPYPIRVNNRDGSSGPYPGAREMTWEEVTELAYSHTSQADVSPIYEITTTTKLLRRVFTFSWCRFREFLRVCDPTFLCLQFANYLDMGVAKVKNPGQITKKVWGMVRQLNSANGIARVAYLGTGPEHSEMVDLNEDFEGTAPWIKGEGTEKPTGAGQWSARTMRDRGLDPDQDPLPVEEPLCTSKD